MRPDTDREQIVREAMDWLITLQETPDNSAVRTRFEAWRTARPEHAAAWTEAQHTWELLGEALSPSPLHQSNEEQRLSSPLSSARLSKVRSHIGALSRHASAKRRARRRRHSFSITATALAACLFLAFLPSMQMYLQADYLSGTGEARQIQLEDGTIVHLGAESALAVNYSLDMRRVRLLAGEAFFGVQPDQRRPFIVTAGQLETTVVGTAFNVRLTPDGASVAVQHGAVRVVSSTLFPPFADRLQAGDWVRMSWREGVVGRGAVPPQQVAAWRQGQLTVKDWTIREVVAELRRYHHGLIILTNDKLGDLKVTGVYNLHDPLKSLRAVAQPYAAVVREVTPYLVFLSAS